jgi:aerobic-type carbon monoxide dehydrogenase small subunit (CoxS/CutS family)
MGHYVLNVNGAQMSVDAPDDESLLFVLRNKLNLSGTKYGCGEGQCGACTVLLNGRAMRSCLIPVSAAEKLTPIQQTFIDEDAMQCGYCTTGMIMNATSLLQKTPHPTDQQIVTAMEGNICRCGTYPRIMAAIRRAADKGEAA